jgi:hypothetical protein
MSKTTNGMSNFSQYRMKKLPNSIYHTLPFSAIYLPTFT